MTGKVLVTGGSGFLGRSLVRLLRLKGYEVRALAHSQQGLELLKSLGAEAIPGDILDYASLMRAAKDCYAVIHMAAKVSFKFIDRRQNMLVNVNGTRNVIKLVEQCNIQRMIYCSSTAVLGGSDGKVLDEMSCHDGVFFSAYEKAKFIAHEEIKSLGKRRDGIITAIPAFVMGPGSQDILGSYIRAFCEGKVPCLFDVNNALSFVFVDDVAEGIYLCLTKGKSGEQYIFAADSCSPVQLVELLEKYSLKRRPQIKVNPFWALLMVLVDESIQTLIGRRPLVTVAQLRAYLDKSWVYSGKKAIEQLGWRPRNLENMIKETLFADGLLRCSLATNLEDAQSLGMKI